MKEARNTVAKMAAGTATALHSRLILSKQGICGTLHAPNMSHIVLHSVTPTFVICLKHLHIEKHPRHAHTMLGGTLHFFRN